MTLRRAVLPALALALGALGTGAAGAAAGPQPGGLHPHEAVAASGDCGLSGVVCKPYRSGSCTGYTSQTTAPATIRVLVRTSTTGWRIDTVPFETYVENVLPNEWPSSWDADALRAGAVAVKSYAWYWVTHYGGYAGSTAHCFDVTDDTSFQVYRAGSAVTRTTSAVTATWPVALRRSGKIVQASYRAYLNNSGEACGAYADGSTLSQWGSQNCVEANTGNKYVVILERYYGSTAQLATTRQRRTAHDFTYTQRSTRALYSSTGVWTFDDGYGTTRQYGRVGDEPVVVDTGDGFARMGVFRPSDGTWHLSRPTGTTEQLFTYGQAGDVPLPGHYLGLTAPSVAAVYRPSTGQWWIRGHGATRYGEPGDVPVPGDWLGDGTTDMAVWRPSTGEWWVHGHSVVDVWGEPGDIPVPADYDGDGTTDAAVYRPSTHRFYVHGQPSVGWGLDGDVPVVGDYTGDGKADLVVYRPSTHRWYVHGRPSVAFGTGDGTPIGAAG